MVAGGKPVTILAQIVPLGQPRYLRSAAELMRRWVKGAHPKAAYGLVVARFISDEGASILTDAGIGYVDLAGNCLISVNNVYVERRTGPNPLPSTRQIKSLFFPKASRILRVLLCNPTRMWRVTELAEEARVSLGQTYNVKRKLIDYELLTLDQSRRLKLANPSALLDRWRENYTFRNNVIADFYSMERPEQIEESVRKWLDRQHLRYAFTLFSGARRVAPFVRQARVALYVDTDVFEVAAACGFKDVDTGANVHLLRPYDDGIYYAVQRPHGASVVSDIQLYLDLYSYRGRGAEQAEFLRYQRIGF
ncbi:hypothetical protein AMJ39_05690 [candidate division TA06 bacterium DG_24]|nr:MAG: hypothetical protein AMJ39_05690 [candidate division TA06 bacterium DG_24]